jgi:hypothetical protein
VPTRTALALAALALACGPAAAAEKKPGMRDLPLWSTPKQPHARAFVPGLQAALGITPDQAEQIEATCRDTIDQPEARTKEGGKAAAAREELHKRLADILTAEQKKLIEKMNDAYARVQVATAEEFQAAFAAAKGDAEETAKVRREYQEAVAEAFGAKLDAILTAGQKKAVERAAEEEKKRAADKAKKKGGG